MFTPEFVNPERGEFVLVANHYIEKPDALALSIAYNRARIDFAVSQLPPEYSKCILHYDARGQYVPNATVQKLRQEFADIHEIRILTN